MAGITSIKIDAHVEEYTEELLRKIHTWLEACGSDAASTAQGVTPVVTGRLKNSIYPIVTDEVTVIVGSNVSYAKTVELGDGKRREGRHMIEFGMTSHQQEFKEKLENILKE